MPHPHDQQMRRPDAKVITRMAFGQVESGVMRDEESRVFLLGLHGRETIPFKIFQDGCVSTHGDLEALRFPTHVVEFIDPKEIWDNPDGIKFVDH